MADVSTMSDEELLKYMKIAHEQDITFNQLVENALRAAIEEAAGDVEGGRQPVALEQRQGDVVVVAVAVVEGDADRPGRQAALGEQGNGFVQRQDFEVARQGAELRVHRAGDVDLGLERVALRQHPVVHQHRQGRARAASQPRQGERRPCHPVATFQEATVGLCMAERDHTAPAGRSAAMVIDPCIRAPVGHGRCPMFMPSNNFISLYPHSVHRI